jgi:hypothetical protein
LGLPPPELEPQPTMQHLINNHIDSCLISYSSQATFYEWSPTALKAAFVHEWGLDVNLIQGPADFSAALALLVSGAEIWHLSYWIFCRELRSFRGKFSSLVLCASEYG